jgi:hypothetical protein
MIDPSKTHADQVDEISKLVLDAQDKLDQVVRALRTLGGRVNAPDVREPDPD